MRGPIEHHSALRRLCAMRVDRMVDVEVKSNGGRLHRAFATPDPRETAGEALLVRDDGVDVDFGLVQLNQ